MKHIKITSYKNFRAIIGVDLGDTKDAICITDKSANILKEYSAARIVKQIGGVGPITALAFVLTMERAERLICPWGGYY